MLFVGDIQNFICHCCYFFSAGGKYEETFVWSLCLSDGFPINEVDSVKSEAKKSDTRKSMEAADVGVSVGVSAGAWTDTGHIPGYAETISVTVTILVVGESVLFISFL